MCVSCVGMLSVSLYCIYIERGAVVEISRLPGYMIYMRDRHSLSVGCSKKVSSDEERRLATEATLRVRGPHLYELWTDGSVVDEIGAGAAIL